MLYILRFYELHISSILFCIFILCIIVTKLALWLQDLSKLTTTSSSHLWSFEPVIAKLNLASI